MNAVLPFVLMLASGFAGLGYQIVWTQQASLWLGHETTAVLAVVSGFFGGLALGAWLLGRRIERSTRPVLWYSRCEFVIGAWSIALAFLLPHATDLLLVFIGAQPAPFVHWSIAFVGTLLLLAPATIAMGATLPAMERVLAAGERGAAAIAPLYAANTFGAVGGVLVCAFALVPIVGLKVTSVICATLNIACAFVALRLSNPAAPSAQPDAQHDRGVLVVLGLAGFLGIGYEVLVVRALSQVAENTVYTFALLLAVYLIGTAIGAALYARRAARDALTRTRLLQFLACTCLAGTMTLAAASTIKRGVLAVLGGSMSAALSGEVVIAFAAFFLPTVGMGALFSALCREARSHRIELGSALGVNTLGAALAPWVFGVALVPAVGLKLALLAIPCGYLLLASERAWLRPMQWIAGGVVASAIAWLPALAVVDVPAGGRIVSLREGANATVSVVADASGVTTLHIDNRQQEGSSATRYADARQALLPILLHPAPQNALFLGLGTGVTAAAATLDPALHVDVAELLPEVLEASHHFTHGSGGPRLNVIVADARRFVRASDTHYDVIVADNFHPARSGSGSLYTIEHFTAVRERLTQEGVFCQWLPLHQLDLATLRIIVRTFLAVYPQATAMIATNSLDTPVIGLIGRAARDAVNYPTIERRAAALDLTSFGLADAITVLGSFIAGSRTLAAFASDAALNTDDRPIVSYRAPRITYAADSKPRDRLIALLRETSIEPGDVLASSQPSLDARLIAYWRARNRFLEAGRDVEPTTDVEHMLAQVRQPLLDVLHISPDFQPAYDPLLRMAAALSEIDAGAARTLLLQLQEAQPARPESGRLLAELASRTH